MAVAAVEAMLTSELEALSVDASYANFVAESIAADDGTTVDEKKQTLQEMLMLALEGSGNEGADAAVSDLIDRAMQLYATEAEEEKRRVAEAEAQKERDALAKLQADKERAAAAKAAATELEVNAVDASMKRLIMANYGYEFESDEEEKAARDAAMKKAAKKAAAAGGGHEHSGPTRASGGGGLDDALGQLDEASERGPDTTGLGRRAKRRVEKGETPPPVSPDSAAAASGAKRVSVVGNGAVLLGGPHQGKVAEYYGLTSSPNADRAGGGVRDGASNDLQNMLGGSAAAGSHSITGRKPKSAKAGGGHRGGRGDDSDSDEGDAPAPASSGPGRGLVEYDPLAVQLNNRCVLPA